MQAANRQMQIRAREMMHHRRILNEFRMSHEWEPLSHRKCMSGQGKPLQVERLCHERAAPKEYQMATWRVHSFGGDAGQWTPFTQTERPDRRCVALRFVVRNKGVMHAVWKKMGGL